MEFELNAFIHIYLFYLFFSCKLGIFGKSHFQIVAQVSTGQLCNIGKYTAIIGLAWVS